MVYLEEMTQKERKYIENLYKLSFPPQERRPFSQILRLQKEGKALPMVIYEEKTGEPAGLCFFVLHKNFALWDFLAIDPSKQDRGYGTAVIEAIKKKFPDRLVFGEVEPYDESADNNGDRIRRMRFYLRNGVRATDMIVNLFGVVFQVMYIGDTPIEFDDYFEVYASIVGKKTAEKNVNLLRREKFDESLYFNK